MGVTLASIRLEIDARGAQAGANAYKAATRSLVNINNNLVAGMQGLNSRLQRMDQRFKVLGLRMRQTAGNTRELADKAKTLSQRFKIAGFEALKFQRALRTFGVAFSGILVTQSLTRWINTAQKLNNQLRTVTATTSGADELLSDLFDVAADSRVGVESTVTSFVRLTRATQNLNLSTRERLEIVETLSKAVVASGAGTAEANASLLQLSQAFNKGKLDGDEFRSVAENLPAVLLGIQKAANITRADLFEFAETGKITTDLLIKGIREARTAVGEDFTKTSRTLSDSFTAIDNAFTRLFNSRNSNRIVAFFDLLAAGIERTAGPTDQLKALQEELKKLESAQERLAARDGAVRKLGLQGDGLRVTTPSVGDVEEVARLKANIKLIEAEIEQEAQAARLRKAEAEAAEEGTLRGFPIRFRTEEEKRINRLRDGAFGETDARREEAFAEARGRLEKSLGRTLDENNAKHAEALRNLKDTVYEFDRLAEGAQRSANAADAFSSTMKALNRERRSIGLNDRDRARFDVVEDLVDAGAPRVNERGIETEMLRVAGDLAAQNFDRQTKIAEILAEQKTSEERRVKLAKELGAAISQDVLQPLLAAVIAGERLGDALRDAAKAALIKSANKALDFIGDAIGNAIVAGFSAGPAKGDDAGPGDGSNIILPPREANARGGISGTSTLKRFAFGGVFQGPTLLRERGGGNMLFGEAGKEAAVPLTRLPSGHLGVRTDGSAKSTAVTYNIYGAQDAREVRKGLRHMRADARRSR